MLFSEWDYMGWVIVEARVRFITGSHITHFSPLHFSPHFR